MRFALQDKKVSICFFFNNFNIYIWIQNIVIMKKLSILITLFSFYFIGFGQTEKIDSLLEIVNSNVADTVKLNAYKDIITYYIGNNIKEAEKQCDEYKKMAFKGNLPKYEINYYVLKGNIEFKKGNIPTAKEIFKKGLNHREIDNYFYPKVSLLNNLATSFGSNEADSALKYVNRAMLLNKEKNNKEGLLSNYAFLSNFYQNKEDLDKAIYYLEKTMKLAIEEDNKKMIAQTHIHMAGLGRKQYDYENAIDNFQKAREIFKINEPENKLMLSLIDFEIGTTIELQRDFEKSIHHFLNYKKVYQNEMIPPILFDLADMKLLYSYIQIGNFKKAEEYYENLKEKDLSAMDLTSKISILGYLSQYEIKTHKITPKTFERIKEAEKIVMGTKSLSQLSFISQILSQYYAEIKDYEQAYSELLIHQEYLDSTKKTENNVIVNTFNRKLNVALKEKENLKLKQENAEQQLELTKENRNKWLLTGGIIGLLGILGIVGFYYKRNQKQKKQIENLQKELHHRVKNNLSIIDTFVEVLKNEFPGEKTQLKLTELQNRIISINEVHRQLYQSRNITRLNLKRYIETLAENLSRSFDKPEIQIKTEIPESAVLGAERSFPVGLITNEFLTNSYKYAFDGDEPGRINITLNEKENDYIMRFSDNGKGLPAGFDIEKDGSFGLRIMKLLTEQLNGAFTLNGNNGVSIEVQFPKS